MLSERTEGRNDTPPLEYSLALAALAFALGTAVISSCDSRSTQSASPSAALASPSASVAPVSTGYAASAQRSDPTTVPRTARIPERMRRGSSFAVTSDREEVGLRGSTGKRETVRWDDVKRILVVTTDKGPRFSDVFIFLEGDNVALIVPQDARGNETFVAQLVAVDGFDHLAFVKALGSGVNAEFPVWSGARLRFRERARE